MGCFEGDKQKHQSEFTYLSSVALHLPLGLVALQVGLFQGEATHAAAQGEEEDWEGAGGRAEAPQRLEVSGVLGHSQGQI